MARDDLEAPVLDFHDVLLRRLDVDLLRDPTAWLNDQVIAFYFEYLAREAFTHAKGLLLVPGNSSFLMANLGPAGGAVVLEPLGFAHARLALFAVNNNPDVQLAGGGSHWSLLAYWAPQQAFLHFDSMAGSNRGAAAAVVAAAAVPGARLREVASAPQQANGYDCGLYVLALARLLCQRYAAAEAAAADGGGCGSSVSSAAPMSFDVAAGEVTPQGVAALRGELLQLVCSKAEAAAGS